jgi:ABC-type spermidine/putrescine transport system permease subunit I
LTVVAALAVSVPAGYALARLRLPFRTAIMIAFLLPQVSRTLLVGLVLSFVTMMSVLSVPMMVAGSQPTMMTVDMAFRINAYGDYPVANALGVISYAITGLAAWFYLRQSIRREVAA